MYKLVGYYKSHDVDFKSRNMCTIYIAAITYIFFFMSVFTLLLMTLPFCMNPQCLKFSIINATFLVERLKVWMIDLLVIASVNGGESIFGLVFYRVYKIEQTLDIEPTALELYSILSGKMPNCCFSENNEIIQWKRKYRP